MSDEPQSVEGSQDTPPPPKKLQRKLRKPKPVCRVHGYTMVVGHTHGIIRYYYCPDPNCRESARQVKEFDGQPAPAVPPVSRAG